MDRRDNNEKKRGLETVRVALALRRAFPSRRAHALANRRSSRAFFFFLTDHSVIVSE
jgi:hypothetical protein